MSKSKSSLSKLRLSTSFKSKQDIDSDRDESNSPATPTAPSSPMSPSGNKRSLKLLDVAFSHLFVSGSRKSGSKSAMNESYSGMPLIDSTPNSRPASFLRQKSLNMMLKMGHSENNLAPTSGEAKQSTDSRTLFEMFSHQDMNIPTKSETNDTHSKITPRKNSTLHSNSSGALLDSNRESIQVQSWFDTETLPTFMQQDPQNSKTMQSLKRSRTRQNKKRQRKFEKVLLKMKTALETSKRSKSKSKQSLNGFQGVELLQIMIDGVDFFNKDEAVLFLQHFLQHGYIVDSELKSEFTVNGTFLLQDPCYWISNLPKDNGKSNIIIVLIY